MAAGDKNDIVIHYSDIGGELPICNNKRYGYSTNNIDEITCKNCLEHRKLICSRWDTECRGNCANCNGTIEVKFVKN